MARRRPGLAPRIHERVVNEWSLSISRIGSLKAVTLRTLLSWVSGFFGASRGGRLHEGPGRPSSRARCPRSHKSTNFANRDCSVWNRKRRRRCRCGRGPTFHERFDAAAGLHRRARRPAGEEHVVFGLEPLQLRFERLQVALDFRCSAIGQLHTWHWFIIAGRNTSCPIPRSGRWKRRSDLASDYRIRNHISGSQSSRA